MHMSTYLSLTSNKAIIILIFFKPHHKFLGFSWEVGGGGRGTCCFLYTVFPFWLTSVSFILTKVMKCLVKHQRKNAVRIACFLDDRLGVVSSYKMTLFHSSFVKKSLQNISFIINEEKSIWKSSQTLVRNKNKLKKQLLLYTNRKTVSYEKFNCITH